MTDACAANVGPCMFCHRDSGINVQTPVGICPACACSKCRGWRRFDDRGVLDDYPRVPAFDFHDCKACGGEGTRMAEMDMVGVSSVTSATVGVEPGSAEPTEAVTLSAMAKVIDEIKASPPAVAGLMMHPRTFSEFAEYVSDNVHESIAVSIQVRSSVPPGVVIPLDAKGDPLPKRDSPASEVPQ